MKKKIILLAAILLFLSGCATRWTKQGFNEGEFKQDSYLCDREANILASQQAAAFSSAVNPLAVYALSKGTFFNKCMEARGYQRVKGGKEQERNESLASTEKQKLIIPDLDKPFATYPTFRVDDRVHRVSIIGSGDGRLEITSILNKFLTEATVVKVIEPGNLQAILGGKIIEYGTGLNETDAQTLSQMLQIDHVLLFEEKISPHKDYVYGGRCVVKINLKIVNIISGEIVYQTMHAFGGYYDPKKYGYESVAELSKASIDFLRINCIFYLVYDLIYAFGGVETGAIFDPNDVVVKYVIPNSLADKAGVRINDRVLEVNGLKVRNSPDLNKIARSVKQGDEIRGKIERGGEILEFNLVLPTIPFKMEEKRKDDLYEKKPKKSDLPV